MAGQVLSSSSLFSSKMVADSTPDFLKAEHSTGVRIFKVLEKISDSTMNLLLKIVPSSPCYSPLLGEIE